MSKPVLQSEQTLQPAASHSIHDPSVTVAAAVVMRNTLAAADMVNHGVHPAQCNAVLDLTSQASPNTSATTGAASLPRTFVLRAGKQQQQLVQTSCTATDFA